MRYRSLTVAGSFLLFAAWLLMMVLEQKGHTLHTEDPLKRRGSTSKRARRNSPGSDRPYKNTIIDAPTTSHTHRYAAPPSRGLELLQRKQYVNGHVSSTGGEKTSRFGFSDRFGRVVHEHPSMPTSEAETQSQVERARAYQMDILFALPRPSSSKHQQRSAMVDAGGSDRTGYSGNLQSDIAAGKVAVFPSLADFLFAQPSARTSATLPATNTHTRSQQVSPAPQPSAPSSSSWPLSSPQVLPSSSSSPSTTDGADTLGNGKLGTLISSVVQKGSKSRAILLHNGEETEMGKDLTITVAGIEGCRADNDVPPEVSATSPLPSQQLLTEDTRQNTLGMLQGLLAALRGDSDNSRGSAVDTGGAFRSKDRRASMIAGPSLDAGRSELPTMLGTTNIERRRRGRVADRTAVQSSRRLHASAGAAEQTIDQVYLTETTQRSTDLHEVRQPMARHDRSGSRSNTANDAAVSKKPVTSSNATSSNADHNNTIHHKSAQYANIARTAKRMTTVAMEDLGTAYFKAADRRFYEAASPSRSQPSVDGITYYRSADGRYFSVTYADTPQVAMAAQAAVGEPALFPSSATDGDNSGTQWLNGISRAGDLHTADEADREKAGVPRGSAVRATDPHQQRRPSGPSPHTKDAYSSSLLNGDVPTGDSEDGGGKERTSLRSYEGSSPRSKSMTSAVASLPRPSAGVTAVPAAPQLLPVYLPPPVVDTSPTAPLSPFVLPTTAPPLLPEGTPCQEHAAVKLAAKSGDAPPSVFRLSLGESTSTPQGYTILLQEVISSGDGDQQCLRAKGSSGKTSSYREGAVKLWVTEPPDQVTGVAQAMHRWTQSGAPSRGYNIVQKLSCASYCFTTPQRPALITVDPNNRITSAEYVDRGYGAAVPEPTVQQYFKTVQDLFSDIAREYAAGHGTEVTFDDQHGYPTRMTVTSTGGWFSTTVTYTLSGLEVKQGSPLI